MAEDHVIYSEPSVTIKAKDFLTDNSQSDEYKKAANKAVSEVVSAIRLRIDQSIELDKNTVEIAVNKQKAQRKYLLWFKKKK